VLDPNSLSDIKDIRTDETILIPLKYNEDSDKGLGNLHACCACLFIFFALQNGKSHYIWMLLDNMSQSYCLMVILLKVAQNSSWPCC